MNQIFNNFLGPIGLHEGMWSYLAVTALTVKSPVSITAGARPLEAFCRTLCQHWVMMPWFPLHSCTLSHVDGTLPFRVQYTTTEKSCLYCYK